MLWIRPAAGSAGGDRHLELTTSRRSGQAHVALNLPEGIYSASPVYRNQGEAEQAAQHWELVVDEGHPELSDLRVTRREGGVFLSGVVKDVSPVTIEVGGAAHSNVPATLSGYRFDLPIEGEPPEAIHVSDALDRRVTVAMPALGADGADRIRMLVSQLADADAQVARQAARQLGEFADPTAVAPLLEALQTMKLHVMVRAECALALGRIGSWQAAEGLIEALADKSVTVRTTAVGALRLLTLRTTPTDDLRRPKGDEIAEAQQDWRDWIARNGSPSPEREPEAGDQDDSGGGSGPSDAPGPARAPSETEAAVIYAEFARKGLVADVLKPGGDLKDAPLLVAFHGQTSVSMLTEGLAQFRAWAQAGFVVLAPRVHNAWGPSSFDQVEGMIAEVLRSFPVDRGRLHLLQASNRDPGQFRDFVFDLADSSKFRPVTLMFLAEARAGADLQRHGLHTFARKSVSVLRAPSHIAAKGQKAHDLNVENWRSETRGRVKRLDFWYGGEPHVVALWWAGLMEGRAAPGVAPVISWIREYDAATARIGSGGQGRGALLYLWSGSDAVRDHTARLQHDVFLDEDVRELSTLIWPLSLSVDKPETRSLMERLQLKLRRTPALVVLDAKGAVRGTFQGATSASRVAAAMRRVSKR